MLRSWMPAPASDTTRRPHTGLRAFVSLTRLRRLHFQYLHRSIESDLERGAGVSHCLTEPGSDLEEVTLDPRLFTRACCVQQRLHSCYCDKLAFVMAMGSTYGSGFTSKVHIGLVAFSANACTAYTLDEIIGQCKQKPFGWGVRHF
jgi:hypothetical protein